MFSLHKYFLCAALLKREFYKTLDEKPGPASIASDGFRSMLMWYGMLYAVVEGWRDLALSDASVDAKLLDADKVEVLRRCRNSVFHFGRDYFDARLVKLVQAPEIVPWLTELHDAVGAFYLAWFANNKNSEK